MENNRLELGLCSALFWDKKKFKWVLKQKGKTKGEMMAQPLQETHQVNDRTQKETIDKIVTQVGFLMLVLHCLDFLFAVILSLTFFCNLQHDVLC